MGQPITVVEKPSSRAGIVRFEINRSITGMGHERFRADDVILGVEPAHELARRLFQRGGISGIHINSNMITVELAGVIDAWHSLPSDTRTAILAIVAAAQGR